jgi:diaminopimelate epimerase
MKTSKTEHIFYKYSGAGNTFLISSEKLDIETSKKKELIKKICSPTDGFMADGVLFLDKKQDQVVWDFYNSDGSTAEMCGNAARCAFRFSEEHLFPHKDKIEFVTLAGIVKGFKKNDLVAIEMTPVKNESGNLLLNEMADQINTASLKEQLLNELAGTYFLSIDTGVPHLVFEIKNFNDYKKLKNVCAYLRALKLFPRGTNVTMISISNDHTAKAVTFERGVEDFTLACGTGAVAAAKYVELKTKKNSINIQMPGGDLLVDFESLKSSPILIGQAILIGKIIVEL